MKIGVLGGSFDPPHAGHLALAQAALEQLELDEVYFMPTSRNPLKQEKRAAHPKQRLEMVQKLIENHERFALCDLEVTKGGVSYTVDAMTELAAAQPADYWFILGADAAKSLNEWKQPQRLVRLCRLAVVARPPLTVPDVLMRIPEELKEFVDVVTMPTVEISSSEIRLRIGAKQPLGPLVPQPVADFIKANKLYQLQ